MRYLLSPLADWLLAWIYEQANYQANNQQPIKQTRAHIEQPYCKQGLNEAEPVALFLAQ